VGLVDDQKRAVVGAELADGVHEARLGQHDSDVRERRLHEEARHVLMLEHALQRAEVVELRHPRGLGRIERRAHEARSRPRQALRVEDHERLVHRAVVAPVEDSDSGSPGHVAAHPDHPAVRVGRGERELPVRKAEAASQLGAHPRGVLGREHRGDALDLADRPHCRLRRVARHRAGVA
jgi:hypothetical protein